MIPAEAKEFTGFKARELPREEYFVSGHRACQGCAEALALRLITKALGSRIIIANVTGCMEIISSAFPQTAWEVPWIHVAFENAAAVASGIESALKVLMRKGKIKKEKITALAVAGDGGTADIGIQALSGALERGHDFIYICVDNEAYMNCLSTSSLIMTKEGLKRITDVKVSDEVYAFDRKNHKPVLKRCTGVFDNGVRKVYELKTLHHSIKATANHPFLTLKRNGRGKRNTLIWKTLSELKPGDKVVILKNLDIGKSFKFNIKRVRKGDYKVTHLNEIDLPEFSNPNLMKYFGIWVGDGWIRPQKGEVGFALPEGSKARSILLELRYQNFLIDNDYFEMEEVKNINLIGEEPTLDLRVEDEHNFIADGFVVHNTGIQRSSSTPYGARTTTSPPGKKSIGQITWKKNMPMIAAAHGIPYVATACPTFYLDLMNKIKRASLISGPAYIHCLCPCPTGWRYSPDLSIKIGRLAVETGFFPLYEIVDGGIKITHPIRRLKPVKDYLQLQGRFRHLGDEHITEIQDRVNKEVAKLIALEKFGSFYKTSLAYF